MECKFFLFYACAAKDVTWSSSSVGRQWPFWKPAFLFMFTEKKFKYMLVPPEDACHLRLVYVPRTGSCFFSCIALAAKTREFVYEWNCVQRDVRNVAVEEEREKEEEAVALEVFNKYQAGDNLLCQRTPGPEEYELIAQKNNVTVDVHLFIKHALHHFLVNPGQDTVVKMLSAGTGGERNRDCTGHFDFLTDLPDVTGSCADEAGSTASAALPAAATVASEAHHAMAAAGGNWG